MWFGTFHQCGGELQDASVIPDLQEDTVIADIVSLPIDDIVDACPLVRMLESRLCKIQNDTLVSPALEEVRRPDGTLNALEWIAEASPNHLDVSLMPCMSTGAKLIDLESITETERYVLAHGEWRTGGHVFDTHAIAQYVLEHHIRGRALLSCKKLFSPLKVRTEEKFENCEDGILDLSRMLDRLRMRAHEAAAAASVPIESVPATELAALKQAVSQMQERQESDLRADLMTIGRKFVESVSEIVDTSLAQTESCLSFINLGKTQLRSEGMIQQLMRSITVARFPSFLTEVLAYLGSREFSDQGALNVDLPQNLLEAVEEQLTKCLSDFQTNLTVIPSLQDLAHELNRFTAVFEWMDNRLLREHPVFHKFEGTPAGKLLSLDLKVENYGPLMRRIRRALCEMISLVGKRSEILYSEQVSIDPSKLLPGPEKKELAQPPPFVTKRKHKLRIRKAPLNNTVRQLFSPSPAQRPAPITPLSEGGRVRLRLKVRSQPEAKSNVLPDVSVEELYAFGLSEQAVEYCCNLNILERTQADCVSSSSWSNFPQHILALAEALANDPRIQPFLEDDPTAQIEEFVQDIQEEIAKDQSYSILVFKYRWSTASPASATMLRADYEKLDLDLPQIETQTDSPNRSTNNSIISQETPPKAAQFSPDRNTELVERARDEQPKRQDSTNLVDNKPPGESSLAKHSSSQPPAQVEPEPQLVQSLRIAGLIKYIDAFHQLGIESVERLHMLSQFESEIVASTNMPPAHQKALHQIAEHFGALHQRLGEYGLLSYLRYFVDLELDPHKLTDADVADLIESSKMPPPMQRRLRNMAGNPQQAE
eukprot:c11656_g1_i1.p1 GENE.c11656_g1_i1~~c11656_g1_i1.p1  ORF type:complete len:943 (+),score=165.86 c11656_g1_i1:358-2829(+)